jgi:hypothetical protein
METDHSIPPSFHPYHLCVPGLGVSYTLPQVAVYTLVPTTVCVATSSNSTLVTTLLTIHVLQGVCVVNPVAAGTLTAVVDGQAPLHTVGPGMI